MTRRVAIVDDAKFIREALARLLEGDDRVSLVGSAACCEELLENLDRWRPDVITLDLHMPGMGGLETLDRLMAVRPTPVIILSTHSGKGAPQTLEALSRGAVDFIDKEAYSLIDFHALRTVLLDKILGVAQLDPDCSGTHPHEEKSPKTVPDLAAPVGRVGLIAIGASTGGPLAIEKILCRLPSTLPVPVVIVQHMPLGFSQAFAERLDRTVPLTVREIADGDLLLPGTVAGGDLRRRFRNQPRRQRAGDVEQAEQTVWQIAVEKINNLVEVQPPVVVRIVQIDEHVAEQPTRDAR